MTLLPTVLLEKYMSYIDILFTGPSSVKYISIGHVGWMENVGHASEDRMSTPAETFSPAVMVSETEK